MASDPYGSCYQKMRPGVLGRNSGTCAFCGIQDAAECHHGMVNYPDHKELKEDQLVQLCEDCHQLATSIRKWKWRFNANPGNVVEVLLAYMWTDDFLLSLRDVAKRHWRKIRGNAQQEPLQRDIVTRTKITIECRGETPVVQREMKSRFDQGG